MKEEVVARGHPNVRATHRTTLEVTKEKDLTPRGDCIIGVRADKSLKDFNDEIKDWLRKGMPVLIEVLLPDYGLKDFLKAYGSPKLTFKHETDIVIRKSEFVCDRTLAIKSSKSARDIDREIVELLKDPKTELLLIVKPLKK
ncbi:DUF371 domain-containing protein [Archaeoglobus profundus]|uniref:DUF371 domain-containing protein n=1 Tax=Archaeoglobus profundus (strain DSM 5631 / JCM 9629 / NBRC 100127 / Av18) TaxID=572546 RepID=D2RDW3_ARCPA|nr:DUF371 domain-containing protein [Archaeoglobus profundus]ADB58307.1 Protein of unknown function DUF371 [Archaeoglobus profundus DSM 5631]